MRKYKPKARKSLWRSTKADSPENPYGTYSSLEQYARAHAIDGKFEYIFEWTSGGYSTVWAKTKSEATKKAVALGIWAHKQGHGLLIPTNVRLRGPQAKDNPNELETP